MRHRDNLLVLAGASVVAGLVTVPTAVDARGHLPGPPVIGTPERCQRLDLTQLDIDVDPGGSVRFEYPGDGYDTCNEAVQVRSHASGPVAVDNHHDPILSTVVPYVADIEAAGSNGLTVEFATDPCYTGLEIHLDGDTLLFSDVFGTGCDLTVLTDASSPWQQATVHVVQQTGPIQPPHVWSTVGDDTTVLTGLPSGTWYVKVFEGWTPGTTIAVNGGPSPVTDTVHDVADGSWVEIDLATAWSPIRSYAIAG